MKRKLSTELLIILIVSIALGFTVNMLSPNGIALVRDDSERFLIDSSKTGSDNNQNQRGKLNKAGFYQPVNIPGEAAKKFFDEGVIFVDGREPHEFQLGHIKGARNIDYKNFKEKSKEEKLEILKDIKKDQIIVSYCGSDSCEISIDNAYEMAKAGFDNIKIYLGGYKEWKQSGYPVED
ncbi:MAG: rhodanese-like domain-containing protein [Ignavibacteria bacterium]